MTALGIIATAIVLVFLIIGAIGGNNAFGIPWAVAVANSSGRFGILNISYRYILNIFLCFGQSGWTWDFTRIFILGAFWAAVIAFIVIVILSAKKEKRLVVPSIFLFLDFIGGLWVIEGITYARYLDCMHLRYAASFAVLIIGGLCSIICFLIAVATSHQITILENKGCDLVVELDGRVKALEEKVAECEKKHEVVEEAAPVEEPAPAPVVEETVVEEPAVEETVVAVPAAEEKTGNLNIQRIPFADKYKAADDDLRAKFDELSAYVTNTYGIKARESIAGVSFSAHREKLVFVTIIGKHLRCNFALDANNYHDSTLPVVNSDNKKYADVPLTLKVKSGLSLRRAKGLVDDVMAAKGIEKVSK